MTFAKGVGGLATIQGTVTHGPLAQPKLRVTLTDGKGKIVGAAKTDDKGVFTFAGVPPGEYTLYSGMSSPALVGRTNVTVPPGQEKIAATIKLLAK